MAASALFGCGRLCFSDAPRSTMEATFLLEMLLSELPRCIIAIAVWPLPWGRVGSTLRLGQSISRGMAGDGGARPELKVAAAMRSLLKWCVGMDSTS